MELVYREQLSKKNSQLCAQWLKDVFHSQNKWNNHKQAELKSSESTKR